MKLTTEERDFARHALGLSHRKVGRRNHYRAGGDDVEIGRSLVRKGLAIELSPSDGFPDPCFMIVSAGFRAVAQRGEKMDREEVARMKRIDHLAFNTEPVI